MKTRFTSVDIQSAVAEIGASEAIGLRVANIYDIDNKTYLIRVVHGEVKKVILVESGSRIHLSEYDWPKNSLPSGFSMKCRKHLKGRRLSGVVQLGVDRIVDMTFGYNEAAYHLIVELYDRGNILLTDHEYTILQLLRVRADTDKDVKYAVRETYPIEHARQHEPMIPQDSLTTSLMNLTKPNEPLKRVLNPFFVYGPAVIEHCLLLEGLQPNAKVPQQFDPTDAEVMGKLMQALQRCEVMMKDAQQGNIKGFIVQKRESQVVASGEGEGEKSELLTYNEFHPFLYEQHKTLPYMELPSFNQSVDEFFSKIESQKIDMKALQVEKAALKRLENVRQDHEKRIDSLKHSQDADMAVAELIEINLQEVERAIATINSAIANQYDWEEIQEIVEEAKESNDPVARMIKSLNLGSNQITMTLQNPYEVEDPDSDSDSDDEKSRKKKRKGSRDKGKDAVIDLNLTAFANARKYHDKRRNAAQKEQKTMEASKKALKSAEQKAQETMKEAHTSKMISKTRKTNWFEKFFWFISSENYLVVGGRDQQQNELIVKRYLKPGDLYVHADLHGASSVILKNPAGGEVPPKTLNEAGTMAICYSAAWDARVVTSAWWVHHNQVSKTAPSGEYLTTGSFMIRGKKNYLPPSYLVMGFAVIFKMDEASIANHVNDRRVKILEEGAEEISMEESANIENGEADQEIELNDGDEDGEEEETLQDGTSEDGLKEEDVEALQNGHSDGDLVASLNSNLKLENSETNGEIEIEGEQEPELEKDLEEEEEEEEESNFAFPDTNIELKHVDGESFQLHRGVSSTTTSKYNYNDNDENENEDDDFVYLGDGEKVSMKRQEPEARKPRLSAKQRRELKKKNKAKLMDDEMVEEAGEENGDNHPNSETIEENEDTKPSKQQQQQNNHSKQQHQPQQQQQPKRRQKSKQKKMKEKYKDQDEEDKQLMQQLLRSHEPERPPKKKGKQKQIEKQQQQRQQQQQAKNKQNNQQQKAKTLSDVVILHQPDGEPLPEGEGAKPPADADVDDDEDEDPEESKESVSVMDSLTGCPRDNDILLYAVPFCAPYSCLNNFKFKVKLTPGTGRRGKAAKTALHMFQSAKETSDWEKELIKCLKDVDISRNIPGKVKVSAPNLQKAKKK